MQGEYHRFVGSAGERGEFSPPVGEQSMANVTTAASGLLALGVVLSTLRAADSPKSPDGKQAAPLAKSVDLRPQMDSWGLGPRGQGPRGTCSVFATVAALEFAVAKHRGRGTPLSVEYLNWASNDLMRDPTDGGYFHDMLKAFERYGICSEADMPYQRDYDPKLKPTESAKKGAREFRELGLRVHWINPLKPQAGLTDDHLREIQAVLGKGYPVAAGSGHSRLIVGYVVDAGQPGGGKFLTKDSGAAAYDSITFAFTKEQVGDVFWVEAPAPPNEKQSPR